MKLNSDISQVPWKKVSLIAAIVLVVAGAAFGGWTAMSKRPSHPVTPEGSKALLQKHLRQRAERSEFKANLELLKEKQVLNPIKAAYDAPPDYKTVYRNIGDHLALVEHLLRQPEGREQVQGMRIAAELADTSVDVAVDPWLAARIVDTYIMPNLERVEEKPKNGPTREHFMNIAGRIYRQAEEKDRQIELAKAYVEQAPPGQRADQARWRLARALEQNGDHKEALKYLNEIKHPSLTNDVARRIPIIEQNMKTARK
ncbi:MAG: tetratricopeptide repeat protein [Limisphaerales bacterium]